MGLDQFRQNDVDRGAARFKTFGAHEADEKLNRMVEKAQQAFPEEVRVDFVEVSPHMTKHNGKAYWRTRDGETYQYMRISEDFLSRSDDDIMLVVLHEMCHLYLYQNGCKDLTERDPLFTWVLGRVGAHLSGTHTHSERWKRVAEPMLEDYVTDEV